MQEVSGGSGFGVQNQRRLHFGVGKEPHIDKSTVEELAGHNDTGMTQTLEA